MGAKLFFDLVFSSMEDEIIARCSTLKITEEEDNIVELGAVPKNPTDNDFDMAIVGKVMTRRPYNFEALKRTMNQIWAISKHALFRSIENGFFVVQFASARDKMKVMEGRPWTFDQHLVMMNDIDKGVQPSAIALDCCPFWVRLYNLPLDSRTEHHIRLIGSSIGEVLDVESDGILWDRSARVKIMLNIKKPLRRILKVRNSKGHVVIIEAKYERLPVFCYVCGVLGHMERDCTEVIEEGGCETKQWGPWLKASPRRGGLKKQEEAKRFLSCSKKLQYEKPQPDADVDDRRRVNPIGVEEFVMAIPGKMGSQGSFPQEGQLTEVTHGATDNGGSSASTTEILPQNNVVAQGVTVNHIADVTSAREVDDEEGREIRGVMSAKETMGELGDIDRVDQRAGPMESLSFSIGQGFAHGVEKKKTLRRVHVGRGKINTNGVGKSLGAKRKNEGGLESGMDGDDVDMEATTFIGKRMKVVDDVEGEGALLTVAEVGMDQPREDQ